MTTQTKQYRNVSKIKVARKMAKKLAVGAMKVAVAPIVGNLPIKYKMKFYGNEYHSDAATFSSVVLNWIGAPVIGGYLGSNIGSYYGHPVLGMVAGSAAGLFGNAFNEFNTSHDASLIGYGMLGIYGSVKKSYLESIRETRNEERRKLSRFEKLKSELEEITEFSNDEYLKYSTKPESENDREKLREVA